ncbi:hypothetical protein FACS1894203_4260 [Bacteroidia bacterium]|nr:hypothetical protein FACS1894203_4260 [Bacteroidia bacterium]
MRVTFFLFLLCGNFLWAGNSYSQKAKVTINEKNVSLEKILDEIENQTDYLFIYNRANVDVDRQVSVKSKNKPVKEVLDEIFENTDEFFSMEGTHIILSGRKSIKDSDTQVIRQSDIRITGIITDQTGEPVPGVNIRVKGTTIGTVSKDDGTYSINVPGKDAVLVYTLLGYKTQESKVGNQTFIDITMDEDTILIDEVVIVGYGSTSKRKIVSSISSIPVEAIEALPSSSVVNNLGGRAPGLIVTGQGGGPNNNSTISIRGGGVPKTSTGSGSTGYTQGGGRPLVVIDGVISDYSVFQNMNSSDIENLNILKDASAAAVYGARAGNGVLLVTTKKGMNKPLSIKYDFNYSMSQPTILPEKIGSYEKAMYSNEAYKNDNLSPLYSNEVLEKYRTGSDPYNYPNVDWQDLALNNFAPEYKHNLSINGGDGKNNYYASLSYYNQGSLYVQNTNSVDLYTARLNITNSFDKIGLKTTTGLSGNFKQFNSPYYGYYYIWGHIQNRSPMDLAYNDLGMYATTTDNPLVEMDSRSGYDDRDWKNLNGLFKAEWMVPYVEGLKLTSLSNYYMTFYNRKQWKNMAPQSSLGSTTPVPKNPPQLYEEFAQGHSYTQQFLANYDRRISDFSIGLLGGYEFTKGFDSNLNASRENYQLNVDQFLAGPTDNMKNNGSEAEYGRAGWLGRLKLDYKAKYLLEASFRYDGSDWFPKDKRWGTFYAFSGGWVVSDETFMKELQNRNIINMLKVKGSYGIVGLDGDLTKDLDDGNPFLPAGYR